MNGRVDDAGSMTLWVLTAAGVVLAAAAASCTMGAAIVARHRAAAAADTAALAAAAAVIAGPHVACAKAAATAEAGGAELSSCQGTGAVVTVSTTTPVPVWLRWAGPAQGRSRAGPVSAYPTEPGRTGYAS
jgi:secretion/DNA translocation related TadE-like protein